MGSVSSGDAKKQPLLIITDQNGNIIKTTIPNPLQIGLDGVPVIFSIFGSLILTPTLDTDDGVVKASGGYQLRNTDAVFLRTDTTSTGTTTVLTPATPNYGQIHVIKDAAGIGASANLVIRTPGGELIDGSSSLAINTNYGVKIIQWYGSNWAVISGS